MSLYAILYNHAAYVIGSSSVEPLYRACTELSALWCKHYPMIRGVTNTKGFTCTTKQCSLNDATLLSTLMTLFLFFDATCYYFALATLAIGWGVRFLNLSSSYAPFYITMCTTDDATSPASQSNVVRVSHELWEERSDTLSLGTVHCLRWLVTLATIHHTCKKSIVMPR